MRRAVAVAFVFLVLRPAMLAAQEPEYVRLQWWHPFVASAGVAALFLIDEPVHDYVQGHRSASLDDVADVAVRFHDPTVFIISSSGAMALGLVLREPVVAQTGLQILVSYALASGMMIGTKWVFGRSRPNATPDDPMVFDMLGGGENAAFPSGASTVTLSLATTVADAIGGPRSPSPSTPAPRSVEPLRAPAAHGRGGPCAAGGHRVHCADERYGSRPRPDGSARERTQRHEEEFMRTAPSTLLISVAALTLACAPAAEMPEDTTADVAAIEAVRAQEVAAITSGDTSLAYLTDDAVVMPPGAPQVAGKAALRNWMREFMAAVTIQAATYDQSTITVAGDWAIEHYTGTVTMMPASGGAAMTESMKGIHVYRRGADGTWKMAMDVWNTDSAPPGM